MRTLICGSIAYDNIMVFRGRFRDHILPDQIHILNVAFLVPELRREFGGCAGNIAYNLKLLGSDPLVMATVGDDARRRTSSASSASDLSRDCVRQVPGTLTAQAFITTDLDDNQITAFHPGAMNHSHENKITARPGGQARHRRARRPRRHAAARARTRAAGHSVHVRPRAGAADVFRRGTARFRRAGRATSRSTTTKASSSRSAPGATLEQLAGRLKALILTRGAEGSVIYAAGSSSTFPASRRPRRWIPPAAETPTAPACSTGSRPGSTGTRPDGSRR